MAPKKSGNQISKTSVHFLFGLILIVPMFVPFASAAFSDLCAGVALVTSTNGQCDEYDHADDETPFHQEWIKADYRFELQSTNQFSLQITWAIHEYNREALGFGAGTDFGDELEAQTDLDSYDGIPVDLIREVFDFQPDGSSTPSVGQIISSAAYSTIETSLSNGFGEVLDLSTSFEDEAQFGTDTIQCSTDSNTDSLGEGASEGNVFEPPICLTAQATIQLDSSTFNLFDNEDLDMERAYQGLLVMGAEVETPFAIRAEPGMNAIYTIAPPPYARIIETDSAGSILLPGTAASKGQWSLDHRDATMSDTEVTQDITFRVAHQPDSQTPTVAVPDGAKSLDLRVILNLEDESAVTLDFIAGIYYLEETTLSDWGISIFELTDAASIPLITSDGIRLAYHNGIIDLPTLTQQFPIDNITDGIASTVSDLTTIEMNPAQWVSSTGQTSLFPAAGGLNYTHSSDCKEPISVGVDINYCLEGSMAMDGTYPVYLQASSEPFSMRLVDIMKKNIDNETIQDLLTSVDENTLERLFNSNISVETVLQSSYLDAIVPDILPNTSLAVEIILPSWIETKDGDSKIVIEKTVDGMQDTSLSFRGTNPYDWQHEILGEDESVLCLADQKSCVISDVEFDWSGLGIHEWSQAVSFQFAFSAELDIYRIGIPLDRIEREGATQVTFPAMPSDLLRLLIDISSRMNTPIQYSDIYLCDSDSTPIEVCGQPLTFVATREGMKDFFEQLSERITDYIHQYATYYVEKELEENPDSPLKVVDLSAFQIELEISGIDPPVGEVSDETPLGFSINIPEVEFKFDMDGDLQKLQAGDPAGLSISILTDAATAPLYQSMHAMLNVFQSLLFNSFVSLQGLTLPSTDGEPMKYETGQIDPVVSEEFDLSFSGPVTMTLPRGLQLIDVSSTAVDENGNSLLQIDDDGGRQTITYTIPPHEFEDDISYKIHISWLYFLIQFWYYPTIVLLLLFLLIRRRRRKKRSKKERLNQQYEAVQKTSLDDSYFSAYVSPSMNEGYEAETLDDFKDGN